MGWGLFADGWSYHQGRHFKTGLVVGQELYDYQADPSERENLAHRPEYAAILKTHQLVFDRTLAHLPKAAR